MVSQLKRGAAGYSQQMSTADWDDYKKKVQWFQDMEVAGKLQRGWKKQVADSLPFSYTMFVNTLAGRHTSPPVIDAAYRIASRMVGETPAYDIFTEMDNVEKTRALVLTLLLETREGLEASERMFNDRITQMTAAHEFGKVQTQAKIARLEAKYAQLGGRYEGLLMKAEDEHN